MGDEALVHRCGGLASLGFQVPAEPIWSVVAFLCWEGAASWVLGAWCSG